jgi:hypothetical protein
VAGKIVADIIEAPAGRISLNVANVTVASINASGLYTSTGNLLITQANQIGRAALPAGSVLQVVNATSNVEVSSTSTTYADTGLTATITPSSASSKILVLVDQCGVGKRDGDTRVKLRLLRGITEIIMFENNGAYTASTSLNRIGSSSTCFLDSPATTGAVTYKTQFGLQDGSGSAAVQYDASRSTITLLEIAA